MKLHHVLFIALFIAGAWISNYKSSQQGRVPASVSAESVKCEKHCGQ